MPPAVAAKEPLKPDVKQLPFTKVTAAIIGLAVFACQTPRDGLANPRPAIVTRVYPDQADVVDIETFHPRADSFMHAHPVEQAVICFNQAELEKAVASGRKWVCYPYDPADPRPFVQAANKPAPKRPGTPE